jgi:hypothetical protein
MDLNMDGIEDGAEVTLQRKALDQNGVDQIMTAKWKYKRPSDPGGAYAGEHRGVMSNVGNRAATNAQYAGADMAGQARAGVEADAEFQPVSMMTPKGQVSGSDRTIQSIMDAESVPFARTATTNDVNAKSLSEYDAFNERSAANLRIMTGGRTSGGPEAGSDQARGEQADRAARIMESGSVRPDQRRLATGTVARYMGEEEAAKSRISDQRIQQILSGGKVEEAQAKAQGDTAAAEAERIRAEQANETRLESARVAANSREAVATTKATESQADRESRERMAKDRNAAYLEGRKMIADARKETDPQKLRTTLNRMEQHNFGSAFGQPQSIGQYVADTYDPTTGQLRKAKAADGTETASEIDIAKEAHLDAINELRGRIGMPPLFQRAEDRGTTGATPAKAATPPAAPGDTVSIRAPDGTVRRVPRANAQKYVDKGGVIVE